MPAEIVASATSKWGGACARCDSWIDKGGTIHKISTPGGTTTQAGQGPGEWVCIDCARRFLHPDHYKEDE